MFPQVDSISMVGEGRSHDSGITPAVMVDVAPVKPIPVPTRRTLDGAIVASGTICLVNSQVTGSLVIGGGASLDIENSTIGGSTVATRASNVRMCASTVRGSIAITGSTGFVLIGDAGDGCVPNVIRGGDVLLLNSGGLEAIGNTIRTSLNLGNSGRGPFPEDAAPEIEGNHP